MASSDLDTLIDMGFERARSEIAVKQIGGLQGAIDWLDKNQDNSLEEIKEASTTTGVAVDADDGPALKPGEEPRSLVCNECGKKFRSQAQAEFHASKTEHVDFSESTEEIAPLTEEEKKAKLQELRERAAAKRAGQSEEDKINQKRNDEIRRRSTKEQSDAKEELARKEQIKEAQAKRREQVEAIEAKKRIQARIAADKEERKLKAEREKAARSGAAFPERPAQKIEATPAAQSKPASAYTETRLRLQTSGGTVQRSFPVQTTLFEVAHAVAEENGTQVQTFSSTFPRKTWDTTDFGMTLKEAGLIPSAALIAK